MTILVDDHGEPKPIAYLIGGILAGTSAVVANVLLGWPFAWHIIPISFVLGLIGVFMIESGCEALVVMAFVSIPLAFVLWHEPEYSLWKQLLLTAVTGHGTGKLWVGVIR